MNKKKTFSHRYRFGGVRFELHRTSRWHRAIRATKFKGHCGVLFFLLFLCLSFFPSLFSIKLRVKWPGRARKLGPKANIWRNGQETISGSGQFSSSGQFSNFEIFSALGPTSSLCLATRLASQEMILKQPPTTPPRIPWRIVRGWVWVLNWILKSIFDFQWVACDATKTCHMSRIKKFDLHPQPRFPLPGFFFLTKLRTNNRQTWRLGVEKRSW